MVLASCFAVTSSAMAAPGHGDHAAAARRSLSTPVSATGRSVAGSANLRVSVSLNRDASAMKAMATAVSTPGSASYRQFLSAAQVSKRYGATKAQQSAVRRWLAASGLRVTHTDPFMITATGPANRAEHALAARIGSTGAPGSSSARYVALSRMSVPASVGSVVNTVNLSPIKVAALPTPLPNTPTTSTTGALTTAGLHAPRPCSQYFGQKIDTQAPPAYGSHLPYSGCWYTPSQVRSAYGFPKKLSGRGVTVATMGGEPLTGGQASIQKWSKLVGIPQLRSGQLTQIGLEPTSKQSTPVALDEWVGDLEAVHGLAPDADLVYVWSDGSITGDPFADDLTRVVDNHLADVVSASIGDTADWDSILNPVLQRAALEGITVNEAAGDWGSPVDKSSDPNGYMRDPRGRRSSAGRASRSASTATTSGRCRGQTPGRRSTPRRTAGTRPRPDRRSITTRVAAAS
ncbi:protease pro-enzyme activation domain-containing protein [Flexivirga caeni]|nr:protease pro-enzyme activation domain-containing protein [Flexivirga caeni]